MKILIFTILAVIHFTCSMHIDLNMYGNFCGRDFTMDDNHIQYPIDEIDRMCQILNICMDAYKGTNDNCFCYQQALWTLQNIYKESDIKTKFYKIILNLLDNLNCSKIYSSFDLETSFGMSNGTKYNYLTFYPPHKGAYINLARCQQFLNFEGFYTTLEIYNFSPQQYANFLLHGNEGKSWIAMADANYCNNNNTRQIIVEQDKIFVLKNTNRWDEAFIKVRIQFTFEKGFTKSYVNSIKQHLMVFGGTISLLLLFALTMVFIIKKYNYNAKKEDMFDVYKNINTPLISKI